MGSLVLLGPLETLAFTLFSLAAGGLVLAVALSLADDVLPRPGRVAAQAEQVLDLRDRGLWNWRLVATDKTVAMLFLALGMSGGLAHFLLPAITVSLPAWTWVLFPALVVLGFGVYPLVRFAGVAWIFLPTLVFPWDYARALLRNHALRYWYAALLTILLAAAGLGLVGGSAVLALTDSPLGLLALTIGLVCGWASHEAHAFRINTRARRVELPRPEAHSFEELGERRDRRLLRRVIQRLDRAATSLDQLHAPSLLVVAGTSMLFGASTIVARLAEVAGVIGQTEALARSIRLAYWSGDFRRVVRYYDRGRAETWTLSLMRGEGAIASIVAFSLAEAGRVREALELARRARDEAARATDGTHNDDRYRRRCGYLDLTIAHILGATGCVDEAIELTRRCTQLDPECAKAANQLVDLRIRAWREQLADAVALTLQCGERQWPNELMQMSPACDNELFRRQHDLVERFRARWGFHHPTYGLTLAQLLLLRGHIVEGTQLLLGIVFTTGSPNARIELARCLMVGSKWCNSARRMLGSVLFGYRSERAATLAMGLVDVCTEVRKRKIPLPVEAIGLPIERLPEFVRANEVPWTGKPDSRGIEHIKADLAAPLKTWGTGVTLLQVRYATLGYLVHRAFWSLLGPMARAVPAAARLRPV